MNAAADANRTEPGRTLGMAFDHSTAMILENFEESHASATTHPGYRGSGFLGSHLCEKLLAQGANVLCVDNFFTGNRQNIEYLLDDKHFELIRHDVTFPLYVEVDEIYNLACPASPIHYQRDPVQTTKTSVHGTINMLG